LNNTKKGAGWACEERMDREQRRLREPSRLRAENDELWRPQGACVRRRRPWLCEKINHPPVLPDKP
jgi:hypothetical protein